MGSFRQGEIMRRAPLILLGLLLLLPVSGWAQTDPETLATRIADSLKTIADPRYKTIAFSRIRNAGGRIDIDRLIDFANVKIVRGRRLRVIDRSKLKLIVREQQVHLSDFVSAQKYQELGKLLGVDLFIYGTYYRDALVLKAIDTETSAIAWAEVFPADGETPEATLLMKLGGGVVNSLRADIPRLKKEKIRRISFWDFKPTEIFSAAALMDYLSVAITKDGNLQVVDRENLDLITKEQKLSQAMFIDERSAKRLGELYGVDAFIYGSVSRGPNGTLIASLKMLNIFNGVIEWADLIKVTLPTARTAQPGRTARRRGARRGKGGPLTDMALIPAGRFLMGTNGAPRNANPRHTAETGGYYLDKTEVSNGQYARFVKKKKYRPPAWWGGGRAPRGGENLPVVGISWDDARRYCSFMGKRLPTEAEWEKAARGPSGQTYPWKGANFSPGFTVTRESGRGRSVSVFGASRDLSPYGVKFLAGNVREWVKDYFKPYPGGSKRRVGKKGARVIRGGSWATTRKPAQSYFRGSSAPNLAWQDVGFRCAKAR